MPPMEAAMSDDINIDWSEYPDVERTRARYPASGSSRTPASWRTGLSRIGQKVYWLRRSPRKFTAA
jgi:hypothetical protein